MGMLRASTQIRFQSCALKLPKREDFPPAPRGYEWIIPYLAEYGMQLTHYGRQWMQDALDSEWRAAWDKALAEYEACLADEPPPAPAEPAEPSLRLSLSTRLTGAAAGAGSSGAGLHDRLTLRFSPDTWSPPAIPKSIFWQGIGNEVAVQDCITLNVAVLDFVESPSIPDETLEHVFLPIPEGLLINDDVRVTLQHWAYPEVTLHGNVGVENLWMADLNGTYQYDSYTTPLMSWAQMPKNRLNTLEISGEARYLMMAFLNVDERYEVPFAGFHARQAWGPIGSYTVLCRDGGADGTRAWHEEAEVHELGPVHSGETEESTTIAPVDDAACTSVPSIVWRASASVEGLDAAVDHVQMLPEDVTQPDEDDNPTNDDAPRLPVGYTLRVEATKNMAFRYADILHIGWEVDADFTVTLGVPLISPSVASSHAGGDVLVRRQRVTYVSVYGTLYPTPQAWASARYEYPAPECEFYPWPQYFDPGRMFWRINGPRPASLVKDGLHLDIDHVYRYCSDGEPIWLPEDGSYRDDPPYPDPEQLFLGFIPGNTWGCKRKPHHIHARLELRFHPSEEDQLEFEEMRLLHEGDLVFCGYPQLYYLFLDGARVFRAPDIAPPIGLPDMPL